MEARGRTARGTGQTSCPTATAPRASRRVARLFSATLAAAATSMSFSAWQVIGLVAPFAQRRTDFSLAPRWAAMRVNVQRFRRSSVRAACHSADERSSIWLREWDRLVAKRGPPLADVLPPQPSRHLRRGQAEVASTRRWTAQPTTTSAPSSRNRPWYADLSPGRPPAQRVGRPLSPSPPTGPPDPCALPAGRRRHRPHRKCSAMQAPLSALVPPRAVRTAPSPAEPPGRPLWRRRQRARKTLQ